MCREANIPALKEIKMPLGESYFATNNGEGIVMKVMMEVRVLACKPPSLLPPLLFIQKVPFISVTSISKTETSVRVRPRKGS